ncbi:hypothetical protein [Sinobaca sp. H24]|nr:hypothetical protein [Sinobaca sp. H24]
MPVISEKTPFAEEEFMVLQEKVTKLEQIQEENIEALLKIIIQRRNGA